MTLYSAPSRVLAEEDVVAQLLSDSVGVALLRDEASTSVEGLSSWASRATVHQATGMVIAQLGVSAEDALAVLRAHAFAGDRSLGPGLRAGEGLTMSAAYECLLTVAAKRSNTLTAIARQVLRDAERGRPNG